MGCLLELFFDIFIEGTIELIGYCYLKLMQLIVPNKAVSEKVKRTIRIAATTVAVLLGVALIFGLIFLIQDDPTISITGKYMTHISLTLMLLQIAVGIIMKVVSHFKK